MRRIAIVFSIALVLAALLGAGADARRGPTGTMIKLRKTSIGKILVLGSKLSSEGVAFTAGYTIYGFSPDKRNKDACQRISGCLAAWPPVTTKGKPRAGTGIKQRLLGTIKLRGGKFQVTYNGHPLYLYISDQSAGEVDHVNIPQFGGLWPALNAAGRFVDENGHVVRGS